MPARQLGENEPLCRETQNRELDVGRVIRPVPDPLARDPRRGIAERRLAGVRVGSNRGKLLLDTRIATRCPAAKS
jgi:hypothetical protein